MLHNTEGSKSRIVSKLESPKRLCCSNTEKTSIPNSKFSDQSNQSVGGRQTSQEAVRFLNVTGSSSLPYPLSLLQLGSSALEESGKGSNQKALIYGINYQQNKQIKLNSE